MIRGIHTRHRCCRGTAFSGALRKPFANLYSRSRATSTGHGAWRATRSVVLGVWYWKRTPVKPIWTSGMD